MSVNKSFVIKNGLEVSTDLIFADANISKVGIASTAPRTELDVRGGIAATDLYLAGVATIATLRATTGIVTDLLATNITAGVVTSLSIQTTDINVSGFATAQDLQVDGTATIAVGVVTHLSGTNLNYSGIGTIQYLNSTNLNVTGFSTFDSYADFNGGVIIDNLNVTGVSTLATVDINGGDIEVTSVRTSNLNATGVSTIASLSVTGSTFDTLTVNNYSNLSGITTIDNAIITNLDVVGVATVANLDINGGDIEVSNVDTVDLNVTGVSTLGTVQVSSGIITATSGIVTYYGDGAYLQNISAGIGIGTTGGLVGYAVTFINFYGSGVSTSLYNSDVGIATIFFEGGGSGTIGIGTEFPSFNNSNGDLFYNAEYARIFVYYDENVIGVGTDAYWVDAAPFNVGIITSLNNVSFEPGSAISPSMYFVGDVQTGFFSPTTGETTFVSAGSSILNINASGINVTGVVTATSFSGTSGNFTGVITSTTLNVTSNLSVSGISTTQSLNIIGTGTTSYLRNATIENYSETIVNVGNVGAAYTYTLGYGNYFIATLDQTSTFDFDASLAPTGSVSFIIQLKNGTGGPFSITWPASVEWPAGITPTRTTTDGRTDIWTFITNDGGTNWIGNLNIVNYNI